MYIKQKIQTNEVEWTKMDMSLHAVLATHMEITRL